MLHVWLFQAGAGSQSRWCLEVRRAVLVALMELALDVYNIGRNWGARGWRNDFESLIFSHITGCRF